MDFQFGALVSSRDGIRLGDLHGVAFDRATGEVTSLVVDPSGEEADFRLVPIGAVDSADRREIFVALSDEQFTALPYFAEVRNIAPPPLADNLEDEENKEPDIVPDVPPVGAATGVESIAFTPILQEDVSLPPEDSVIDNSFTVRATDGDVGQVQEVITDDQTNRITRLGVARGTVFTDEVDIPAGWLRQIGPDWISIGVDLATVRERAQENV
jgi:sporulation protein YlmC with PRC-barrel domain